MLLFGAKEDPIYRCFFYKKYVIPRLAEQAVGIRFSKWDYGLPRLLTQARNDVGFSEHQFRSAAEHTAVVRFDIHQHDVRPDTANTAPGNHKIVPWRP